MLWSEGDPFGLKHVTIGTPSWGHFTSSSTGGWAHRGDAKHARQGEHQPCGLRLQAQEMVAAGLGRRALALS